MFDFDDLDESEELDRANASEKDIKKEGSERKDLEILGKTRDMLWKVVGGEGKGGILVRQEEGTTSKTYGERLSTGSIVSELARRGNRLNYRKVSGVGPHSGWVSLKQDTKDLLIEVQQKLAHSIGKEPEVRPHLAGPRKSWTPPHSNRANVGALPPATAVGKERGEAPGDWYKLVFPITRQGVRKAGASWLTQAFHAAGTLPVDNAVESIVTWRDLPTSGPELAGGAGVKAIFSVRYKQPDPALHTDLFLKMPWPWPDALIAEGSDVPKAHGNAKRVSGDERHRRELSNGLWGKDADARELYTHLLLEPLLPVRIPKYYFADISRKTTNYILITEQILFNQSADDPLGGTEKVFIQPAISKFHDARLTNVEEYYYALFAAQARIAAYDKLGRYSAHASVFLNTDDTLPPQQAIDQKVRNDGETMALMATRFGIELVELAPGLFPADVLRPEAKQTLLSDLPFCGRFSADIREYQTADPDYVALVHNNLCVDNAFFWRQADQDGGLLECGLIDWFATSRQAFGVNLSMCLQAAPIETLLGHLAGLCQCFTAEYQRNGGPAISAQELLLRIQLQQILGMSMAAGGLQTQVYPRLPKEAFQSIISWDDPRIQSDILVRAIITSVVQNYAYWLKADLLPILKGWLRRQTISSV